jgi:hypothetical protein
VTPRPCAGFAGFLVPHACPNAAVGDCAKCGRAVCEEHAELAEAGLLCRQCRTGSEFPVGLAAVAASVGLAPLFLPEDLLAFEQAAPEDEPDLQAGMFADLS